VRDINIRATLVTTNDNIDILVPNSEFVTGRVVNWTPPARCRSTPRAILPTYQARPAERGEPARGMAPPQAAQPQAAPVVLPEHERAALASNDACEEVERGAREDEERREAEEAAATEEEPTLVDASANRT
jgi:hypothetical protein